MTDPQPRTGTGHPDGVTLVAFMNDELPAAVMRTVRHHADGCDVCRNQLLGLKEGFDAFLNARAAVSLGSVPPLAPALERFTARLTEMAEARSSARLARHRYWRRIGAMAASVVAAAGLFMTLMPSVSAESVLAQAEVRELVDLRAAHAVMATTIEIQRVMPGRARRHLGQLARVDDYVTTAAHVTIGAGQAEIWRGVIKTRQELAVHIPWREWFDDGIARYARETTWIPDVSVAAYRQLVDPLVEPPTVRKAENGVEVQGWLRFANPTGLSKVVLRIDSASGLPCELKLVTASGEGYALSRPARQYLKRSSEVIALLTPPAAAPVVHTAERALRAPRAPVVVRRLSYDDTMANEIEVSAVEAVHRAGADLGEEVAVSPMSDGSVVVHGVVSTSARASDLASALHGLAHVRSAVQAADRPGVAAPRTPATDRDAERPATEPTTNVRIVDFSGMSLPLTELLETPGRCDAGRLAGLLPAGERPVDVFATRVVDQSSTALVHSWALERLFQQFSGRRSAGLTPEALARVRRVIAAHRSAAVSALRAVQASVDPLGDLCGIAGPAPSGPVADEDVPAISREQYRLVRELFIRTQPTHAPDGTLRSLITILRRIG